ncbi:MAG TPA: hypothetical protein VG711_02935, partial [Phycisphaerales bacterium]|nr:hypothetical protein [Phycisphaerales bacterium]
MRFGARAMMSRLCVSAAMYLSLAVCFVAICCGFSDDREALESSLRLLNRAVIPQASNGHLPLLFALRQLHDPDLRQIFERVRIEPDSQAQIHATLALAELSPDHTLDPDMLGSIAKDAQETVVANAADLKLIPESTIRNCLKLESLDDHARFLLLAELLADKAKVTPSEFARLIASSDTRLSGLSSF